MRDPSQTTFVFVLQPEATPIKETQRATDELAKLDIHTHQIIINGILPPKRRPIRSLPNGNDAEPLPRSNFARVAAARSPHGLLDGEIKGVARLRQVAEMLLDGRPRRDVGTHPPGGKEHLVLSQADILPALSRTATSE